MDQGCTPGLTLFLGGLPNPTKEENASQLLDPFVPLGRSGCRAWGQSCRLRTGWKPTGHGARPTGHRGGFHQPALETGWFGISLNRGGSSRPRAEKMCLGACGEDFSLDNIIRTKGCCASWQLAKSNDVPGSAISTGLSRLPKHVALLLFGPVPPGHPNPQPSQINSLYNAASAWKRCHSKFVY